MNDEQTLAALHTDTPSLIIAGAGSGKTRVLTYKIAYLRWRLKIKWFKILAVTFTNKAANEMKERLIQITKELGNIKIEELDIEERGVYNEIIEFLEKIENKPYQAPNYYLKWI